MNSIIRNSRKIYFLFFFKNINYIIISYNRFNNIIMYTKFHLWKCFQYTLHMTPITWLGMVRLSVRYRTQESRLQIRDRRSRTLLNGWRLWLVCLWILWWYILLLIVRNKHYNAVTYSRKILIMLLLCRCRIVLGNRHSINYIINHEL